ncbi:hypothetical protein QF048_007669 [Streptomyces sp. W4I9-2]|nr:hypothetical protein [Streptomyces sp. W4I9-2]
MSSARTGLPSSAAGRTGQRGVGERPFGDLRRHDPAGLHRQSPRSGPRTGRTGRRYAASSRTCRRPQGPLPERSPSWGADRRGSRRRCPGSIWRAGRLIRRRGCAHRRTWTGSPLSPARPTPAAAPSRSARCTPSRNWPSVISVQAASRRASGAGVHADLEGERAARRPVERQGDQEQRTVSEFPGSHSRSHLRSPARRRAARLLSGRRGSRRSSRRPTSGPGRRPAGRAGWERFGSRCVRRGWRSGPARTGTTPAAACRRYRRSTTDRAR